MDKNLNPIELMIQEAFPEVRTVPELIQLAQGMVLQLETLYKEKEEVLSAFPSTKSLEELVTLAKGMEEQLKSLYAEKDLKKDG